MYIIHTLLLLLLLVLEGESEDHSQFLLLLFPQPVCLLFCQLLTQQQRHSQVVPFLVRVGGVASRGKSQPGTAGGREGQYSWTIIVFGFASEVDFDTTIWKSQRGAEWRRFET